MEVIIVVQTSQALQIQPLEWYKNEQTQEIILISKLCRDEGEAVLSSWSHPKTSFSFHTSRALFNIDELPSDWTLHHYVFGGDMTSIEYRSKSSAHVRDSVDIKKAAQTHVVNTEQGYQELKKKISTATLHHRNPHFPGKATRACKEYLNLGRMESGLHESTLNPSNQFNALASNPFDPFENWTSAPPAQRSFSSWRLPFPSASHSYESNLPPTTTSFQNLRAIDNRSSDDEDESDQSFEQSDEPDELLETSSDSDTRNAEHSDINPNDPSCNPISNDSWTSPSSHVSNIDDGSSDDQTTNQQEGWAPICLKPSIPRTQELESLFLQTMLLSLNNKDPKSKAITNEIFGSSILNGYKQSATQGYATIKESTASQKRESPSPENSSWFCNLF